MRRFRPLLLLMVWLVVGVPLPSADAAEPKLADMLRALHEAREPAKRLALLEPVMRSGGNAAAKTLARLAETDPDLRVRAKAAQYLGRVTADNVPKLVEALLRHGGPRVVRQRAAQAMRRQDGGARILKALDNPRTPPLDWHLLARALSAFRDAESRDALMRFAQTDGSPHQAEALHALSLRKDERTARIAFLVKLLAKFRDVDALLTLMDAAEGVADPLMKPVLERLKTFLDPAIRDGAEHLLTLIAIQEMQKKRQRAQEEQTIKKKTKYGNQEDKRDADEEEDLLPPPPPPPPIRARHDLVYVLDVTGSTWGELPHLVARMHAEADLLIRQGGSVRIGVVAYGASRALTGSRFQVLPLTFDRAKTRAFFDALKSGGVDDRGAAVARGLRDALDRMPWRWQARRTVQLFADSDVDDQGLAKAVVAMHRQADGTRTRFAYLLRTRAKIPKSYFALAKLGGSGTPEAIR